MSRTTHRLTTTAIAMLLVAALAVMLYLSRRNGGDGGGGKERPAKVTPGTSRPPETVETPNLSSSATPANPTLPSSEPPVTEAPAAQSPTGASPTSPPPATDGDRIAIANGETTIIWHVSSASATQVAGGDVTTLAFARGGGLVTGHAGGEIKLWETPSWTHVATIAPGVGAVGRIAFSPAALQAAAIGAGDGGVAVCDAGDRQVKQRLAADKPWTWVDYSPDGHTLAVAGPGGVALWDTIGWQSRPAPGGNDAATFVSFWRGGSGLVTAGADGAIRSFDLATRQPLVTLGGGSGVAPIASLALGADDRTIAVSSGNGVILWDAATRASRALDR